MKNQLCIDLFLYGWKDILSSHSFSVVENFQAFDQFVALQDELYFNLLWDRPPSRLPPSAARFNNGTPTQNTCLFK